MSRSSSRGRELVLARSLRARRGRRASAAGRRRRGDLADASAGDRHGRHRQQHLVLRHEADHARGPRRLRHQRLVAGVVCGRPVRGGEVHERQGDHGRRAAATCRSRSPTSTRRSRRARTRSRVIPDFGTAELAAIQQATRPGVKVVPWGADPGGEATARTTSPTSTGTTGTPARSGRTGWSRRCTARATSSTPAAPPATRSARRSSPPIVEGVQEAPRHEAPDRQQGLAGDELGSGDGAEGDGGAARQVPEDRRHHLELRHRRARERPRVPGGRAQARPGRRRSTRTA